MSVEILRFASVSLSHNPKELKIRRKTRLDSAKLLSGGVKERTSEGVAGVSGRGELFGENCKDDLETLMKLFVLRKSAVLSVPYLGAMRAVLTELSVAAEPRAGYIAVDFEFTAVPSENVPEVKCEPYIKAYSHDKMWNIAYRTGTDVNELVRLNPHIRFIDDIDEGERVRLY